MATLLITALVGIIFAFLATQNTTGVDVRLAGYTLNSIPLYLVALGSLLIGFLISSVVHVVDSIAALFTIHGKDTQIKEREKTVGNLERRIRELEIDNARLRGEKGEVVEREKVETGHPTFLQRFRHNLVP